MTTPSRFAVAIACLLSAPAWSTAQQLPSPGLKFPELIELARAADASGDAARAARLALLARARLVERPDPFAESAIVQIFEDLASGAAERARLYGELVDSSPGAEEGLGEAVTASLRAVADPLAAQVDELIEQGFKLSAAFALEPLWFLDPARALEAHGRIQAIEVAAIAAGDEGTNTALRLSEAMSRGTGGAALASVDSVDPNQDRIAKLRRESALALVQVAETAVTGQVPWLALDVAEYGPLLFALYPNQFRAVRKEARDALAKPRAAASKVALAAMLKGSKKLLPAQDWTVGPEVVQFPLGQSKRALLLGAAPVKGGFRFAAQLDADFAKCPVGIAFAAKDENDFCAVTLEQENKKPGARVRRFVKGTPKLLCRWAAPLDLDGAEGRTSWQVTIEVRGKVLWLRVGTSPWVQGALGDADGDGRVGFFLDERAESTAKERAQASFVEFEPFAAPAKR